MPDLHEFFNHQGRLGAGVGYGADPQAIAVGSTARSGDSALDAKFPPLSWEELSDDLIVASHYSRVVGIYSLEGCLQQGFFARLRTLDWTQSVTISAASMARVKRLRNSIESIIWACSDLGYFLAGLVLVIIAVVWRRDLEVGVSLALSMLQRLEQARSLFAQSNDFAI